MKAIINAEIHTMSGEVIKNGSVVFDRKIIAVGDGIEIPDNCEVIDVKGAHLVPGLIDGHCHVGMLEDSMGFEGDDVNEMYESITPHLRAIDGINPQDRCFEDARRAGITTLCIGPGSSNPIGGRFAALKTVGVCVDDMCFCEPLAIKMALGENPKTVYQQKEHMPSTRMSVAAKIRETLYEALDYKESLDEYKQDPDVEKPKFDLRLESRFPVREGKIPVKVHAHRADDICTAIRLAKEFDIKVTIEHCTDGERVAGILKRENVSVMLGPTMTDRSKPELKSMSYSTYKALSEEGIDVSIITDAPEMPIEYLRFSAAMAVRHGMDEELALAAITVNPAKACGIIDSVGTVEVGKMADFALFDMHPMKFDAQVLMTVIDGETVYKMI